MEEIIKFAKEYNVPVVRPKTLELLLKTIKENNSKRVLEIGTAIGYSGAQILQNSDANLVTIEKYEAIYEIAKNNFKRLGLSNRVKQYLGDAKEVLKDLSDSGEKFDFIFLDGPKAQYLKLLPSLYALLCDDGVLVSDNVLFRGYVEDPKSAPRRFRTIYQRLRKFIDYIENSGDFYDVELYRIEDGVLVARKKNKDIITNEK